jgi:UDP-glucuronate 4-epimerase
VKALVTGVAGFIGGRIALRLLADGHDVVGVDALTDYYDPGIKQANLQRVEHPRFRFVEGDLNEVELAPLLADVEVVFHEAGQPGVRSSWGRDFGRYALDNVCATQRLLEEARGAERLRRFVYASSSSVYGEAERYPTEETDRPQPVSPYGVTKLAAEHLCSLYAHNYGLPTVSLRYFTVYGPGQRPDMAFTRFCRAVHEGRQIELYGTGEQVRDFTYVDDVVEANLRVVGDRERGARAARDDLRQGGPDRAVRAGPRRRAAHRRQHPRDPPGDRLGPAGRPARRTRGAVPVGCRRPRLGGVPAGAPRARTSR